MTTSDKKPRRTTKSAKTAKIGDAAPGVPPAPAASTMPASAIPTLSDSVGAAGGRAQSNGGTRIKAISVSVTSRNHEDRHASIARAAYFLSESRGFEPGHEMEDWLTAEAEVDQRLLSDGRAS